MARSTNYLLGGGQKFNIFKPADLLNKADVFSIVTFTVLSIFILLDLYLCYYVTSFPFGTMLPIPVVNSCYISPFCNDITVKGLMLDPPDFYIHNTLSNLFVGGFDITNSYLFITPTMISFFHVLLALLASKLITNDSLCTRRVGVLLFGARNFLDSLDGTLARSRRKIKALSYPSSVGGFNDSSHNQAGTLISEIMNNYSENMGYWVDGICDAVGVVLLLVSCYMYLQRHPIRKRILFSYTPLPVLIESRNGSSTNTNKRGKVKESVHSTTSYLARQIVRSVHRSGLLAVLFGFQVLFGALFWNRAIPTYTGMLESNSTRQSQKEYQVKANLIRSPMMWIVIFICRYVNPHTFIELLLMAIFFDRMGELMYVVRVWGYAIVFTAACLTEAHMHYAQSLF